MLTNSDVVYLFALITQSCRLLVTKLNVHSQCVKQTTAIFITQLFVNWIQKLKEASFRNDFHLVYIIIASKITLVDIFSKSELFFGKNISASSCRLISIVDSKLTRTGNVWSFAGKDSEQMSVDSTFVLEPILCFAVDHFNGILWPMFQNLFAIIFLLRRSQCCHLSFWDTTFRIGKIFWYLTLYLILFSISRSI